MSSLKSQLKSLQKVVFVVIEEPVFEKLSSKARIIVKLTVLNSERKWIFLPVHGGGSGLIMGWLLKLYQNITL